jgi:hypothetical protein
MVKSLLKRAASSLSSFVEAVEMECDISQFKARWIDFFDKISKLILKFIEKYKRPQMFKAILRKKNSLRAYTTFFFQYSMKL